MNFSIQKILKKTFILFFFTHASPSTSYAKENDIPIDPFLTIVEQVENLKLEKIFEEVSYIYDKNEEINSKIIFLQENMMSKFKEKTKIKIDLSFYDNETLNNFRIIDFDFLINEINVINYKNPIFFKKETKLSIFNGYLPMGKYEMKIKSSLAIQSKNWPYFISKKFCDMEKNFFMENKSEEDQKYISILIKNNKETGIPEFELKIS
jgi:hypothetical protein